MFKRKNIIALAIAVAITLCLLGTTVAQEQNSAKIKESFDEFLVSNSEWLQDSSIDQNLLVEESGFEILTETKEVFDESLGVNVVVISIEKRQIDSSIDNVCASGHLRTGYNDTSYFHSTGPHPIYCSLVNLYVWKCSRCGSSGIDRTATPIWCPSPTWWPW